MMIPRSPSELTRQAKLNGAPPSAGPEGNKSQSVSPNDRTVFCMTTPTRPVFHRGFDYAILFPKAERRVARCEREFLRLFYVYLTCSNASGDNEDAESAGQAGVVGKSIAR